MFVGKALYETRFTPAWPEYYEGAHLLALPGEMRNRIFSYILPINKIANAEDARKFAIASAEVRRDILNANPEIIKKIFNLNDSWRPWDEHYTGLVPAVLQTCRQIRYEYGARYCKSITVHWTIPLILDSSRMTYFTQFAASVGCEEYLLVVFVGHSRTIPALFGRPDDLCSPRPVYCWHNLKLWARDVCTGVETCVLSGQSAADENVVIVNEGDRSWADMAVDDNAPFVMKVLQVARLAKLQGTSWNVLRRTLKHMWKSYVIWNSNDFLE